MSNVTIQKRGKYYQYKFETAKIDGKRKFSSKSGFRTKAEAEKEGIKAYNEYMNTGHEKDTDILYWVGTMNAIKNQAEEIVFNELIYV